LPIAILVVPFVDLVLAVVRRTRAGRSPFAPDKQHLHHRLLEIGHSHRRAVLIMWLWAGLIAFGGVLASLYSGRVTTLILVVWVLLTVALTFFVPRVQQGDPRSGSLDRRFSPLQDFVLVFTSVPGAICEGAPNADTEPVTDDRTAAS